MSSLTPEVKEYNLWTLKSWLFHKLHVSFIELGATLPPSNKFKNNVPLTNSKKPATDLRRDIRSP
ncbi:hypothetical protein [Crenothrix sp.]|uniref:hypothetical protein n=1 Tax=Crenothrix sp. TaxID=3100433 RepID=UPI00374C9E1E